MADAAVARAHRGGVGLAGPGGGRDARAAARRTLHRHRPPTRSWSPGCPNAWASPPTNSKPSASRSSPTWPAPNWPHSLPYSSADDTVVVLAEAPEHPSTRPTTNGLNSLNSFATADNTDTGHADGEYDGGVEVGVEVGVLGMALLGELHDGVTAYLRTDGTIAAAATRGAYAPPRAAAAGSRRRRQRGTT